MSILWIEKYRPIVFNDIIGQNKNIIILKNLIKNNALPHLLLHGRSGTGKTSTIISLINEIYNTNKTLMVMTLDASDDRGINTVREKIKGFAEKETFFNKGVKLIVLDEVDAMTFDAQFALRRIIEKYSHNTRFCLICNYENKIIPAIKVRCLNLKFFPISNNFIIKKLKLISETENIKINNICLKSIAELSNGDLRKSINLLQSIALKNINITKELCYKSAGHPPISLINKMLKYLFSNDYDFNKTYDFFNKSIIKQGFSIYLLIKEINKYILNNLNQYNDMKICNILIDIANLESYVAKSTFDDIYIIGLISIFKKQ